LCLIYCAQSKKAISHWLLADSFRAKVFRPYGLPPKLNAAWRKSIYCVSLKGICLAGGLPVRWEPPKPSKGGLLSTLWGDKEGLRRRGTALIFDYFVSRQTTFEERRRLKVIEGKTLQKSRQHIIQERFLKDYR